MWAVTAFSQNKNIDYMDKNEKKKHVVIEIFLFFCIFCN